MGEIGDLLMPREQLGARDLHLIACLAKTDGGLPYLLLKHVEALGHLAELVTRVGLYGHDVDRGVCGIEVAAAESRHGLRELT